MANHYSRGWPRRFLAGILGLVFIMSGAGVANAANMLDVSSWQTGINVTTTGADIVVAKATEGTGYTNPDCDRVVQQALASGKGAGVYGFANTADSPEADADYFVSQTRGYIGKGIVPILDWETAAPGAVWWAQRWLNRVEAQWGTKPIIYMNQSTENSYNWAGVVSQNYGLWIAAYTLGYQPIYGFNPPSSQPTLRNWPFAVAWQYTSTGRVNGWAGNVDLSVVYGSLDTWRAYAGNSTGQAPPAPVAPTTSVSGSDSELADRVIRGEFGSIPQRQRLLGDRYAAVQAIVNQRLNGGAAAPSGGSCVVVAPGDSLSAIAGRTGKQPYTAWSGYRSGNPNIIYVGETVCFGGSNGQTQSTGTGHRVVAGESLWAIYGGSWAAAAARNGISAPYVIYPGQYLR